MKAWLYLVGLALLAGDVLSQAKKVLNSDTDLLALPSDQLIHSSAEHSSAELLAIEDHITGLPFGARLPGYEKPLYAFSYTVGDDSGSREDFSVRNLELYQETVEPHSENVIYLHNLRLNDSDDIDSELESEEYRNGKLDEEEEHSEKALSTKGNKDEGETEEISKPFGLEKISSETYSKTDEKISEANKGKSALHPSEQNKETDSKVQDINLSLDYLPPGKDPLPQEIMTNDYLPPTKEFVEPAKSISGALPPKQRFPPRQKQTQDISQTYLTLDYLPPKETSYEIPAPSLVPLELHYLPPKTTVPTLPQTVPLELDYLPPKITVPTSPHTVPLELDYLPPKNTSQTELNFGNIPPQVANSELPLDLNYLPPDNEAKSSKHDLSLYYKPHMNEHVHTEIDLDYLPPKQEHQASSHFITAESFIPIGIVRTLVPPTAPFKVIASKEKTPYFVSFEKNSKNLEPQLVTVTHQVSKPFNLFLERENLPIQEIKKESHSPPIQLNKEINKIVPDSVVGVRTEKIVPKAEYPKAPLVSAIYERKEFPLKPAKVYPIPGQFDVIREDLRTKFSEHAFTAHPLHDTEQKPFVMPFEQKVLDPLVLRSKIENKPIKVTADYKKKSPFKVTAKENIPIIIPKPVKQLEMTLPVLKDITNKPPISAAKYEVSEPLVLHGKIMNVPIKPTAEYSDPLPAVADVSDISTKKTVQYVSPDSLYRETIDKPIIPKAEYHTSKPFKVEGETVKKDIDKQKILAPYQIVTQHIEDTATLTALQYQNKPISLQTEYPGAPVSVTRKQVSHKIIPQSVYTNAPLSATYEGNMDVIPVREHQTYKDFPVHIKNNYECLSNGECDQSDVCDNGQCIPGCSFAKDLCVGDAICKTRHHVAACVCPLMFTAKTIKLSGYTQFDCTPMMMSGTAIIRRNQQYSSPRYTTLSYQRPIVAPIRTTSTTGTFSETVGFPVRTGAVVSSTGNPCNPNPCGPNTRCDVNNRGIALCRCIDEYVPDGNTINGCKPQCTGDNECPDDYRCQAQKCVRVCVPGACGLHANCDARNHRAVCACPPGFVGSPTARCTRNIPEVRAPAPLAVDPCIPNPCGENADCKTRGDRPVCSCPYGYEGNPLTFCEKGECTEHHHCPGHLACQGLKCIDPCTGVCGNGAECKVRNNQPVCSCPAGFRGDPFNACNRITEFDVCNPTPCGSSTNCRAKRDGVSFRAVCSCIDNYIGDPLTDCRPECVSGSECRDDQECKNNRCRNPCIDGCGEGSYCDARGHRAVCTCPEYFLGDGYSRCYTECTAHADCASHKACYQFKCIDPCDGACGEGADCKVENHTPICSCPRSHTGDPFTRCRPFTLEDLCRDNPCGTNAVCQPGKDRQGNDRPVCTCPTGYIGNPLTSCESGECTEHNQCPDHEACYGYMCTSPCVTELGSVCGVNADCKVKSHQPVCSCPRGYQGNPLDECSISPSARIAGRSYRKQ